MRSECLNYTVAKKCRVFGSLHESINLNTGCMLLRPYQIDFMFHGLLRSET